MRINHKYRNRTLADDNGKTDINLGESPIVALVVVALITVPIYAPYSALGI